MSELRPVFLQGYNSNHPDAVLLPLVFTAANECIGEDVFSHRCPMNTACLSNRTPEPCAN